MNKISIALFFSFVSFGFRGSNSDVQTPLREWAVYLGYLLFLLLFIVKVLKKYKNAQYFALGLSILVFVAFTLILIYFNQYIYQYYKDYSMAIIERRSEDDVTMSMTYILDLCWLIGAVCIFNLFLKTWNEKN
ncbi:MAG: hypothetical protein HYZ42_17650 [Bacteroidetes bacterium]|nr:hypothetical protein [Bacteroidota bacterium]